MVNNNGDAKDTGPIDALSQHINRLTEQNNFLTDQVNRLTGQVNTLTGQVNQFASELATVMRRDANPLAVDGSLPPRPMARRLNSAPGLATPYVAAAMPAELRFQDPMSFLYNGAAMKDWTHSERAPFFTEMMNYGKFDFLSKAAAYVRGSGVKGDYHEYGCFSASTFRMFLTWSAIFELDFMKFFAFDSFEGLPEVDEEVSVPHWAKGAMAMSEEAFWTSLKQHGLALDRIETIKGFFDETLTEARSRAFAETHNKVAVATVDVDLRASAESVLGFLEPLIQEGTLIYLDDYYLGYRGSPKRGVAGAFHAYEERSSFRFQPFLNAGWYGKSFIAY